MHACMAIIIINSRHPTHHTTPQQISLQSFMFFLSFLPFSYPNVPHFLFFACFLPTKQLLSQLLFPSLDIRHIHSPHILSGVFPYSSLEDMGIKGLHRSKNRWKAPSGRIRGIWCNLFCTWWARCAGCARPVEILLVSVVVAKEKSISILFFLLTLFLQYWWARGRYCEGVDVTYLFNWWYLAKNLQVHLKAPGMCIGR